MGKVFVWYVHCMVDFFCIYGFLRNNKIFSCIIFISIMPCFYTIYILYIIYIYMYIYKYTDKLEKISHDFTKVSF